MFCHLSDVQPVSRVRDVVFCSKHPLVPYIVSEKSEGCGETARMDRLI